MEPCIKNERCPIDDIRYDGVILMMMIDNAHGRDDYGPTDDDLDEDKNGLAHQPRFSSLPYIPIRGEQSTSPKLRSLGISKVDKLS